MGRYVSLRTDGTIDLIWVEWNGVIRVAAMVASERGAAEGDVNVVEYDCEDDDDLKLARNSEVGLTMQSRQWLMIYLFVLWKPTLWMDACMLLTELRFLHHNLPPTAATRFLKLRFLQSICVCLKCFSSLWLLQSKTGKRCSEHPELIDMRYWYSWSLFGMYDCYCSWFMTIIEGFCLRWMETKALEASSHSWINTHSKR